MSLLRFMTDIPSSTRTPSLYFGGNADLPSYKVPDPPGEARHGTLTRAQEKQE